MEKQEKPTNVKLERTPLEKSTCNQPSEPDNKRKQSKAVKFKLRNEGPMSGFTKRMMSVPQLEWIQRENPLDQTPPLLRVTDCESDGVNRGRDRGNAIVCDSVPVGRFVTYTCLLRGASEVWTLHWPLRKEEYFKRY